MLEKQSHSNRRWASPTEKTQKSMKKKKKTRRSESINHIGNSSQDLSRAAPPDGPPSTGQPLLLRDSVFISAEQRVESLFAELEKLVQPSAGRQNIGHV
jgi:hypothetical protein